MTINVKGPDGSNFAFPDGTASSEISSALDTHYGQAKADEGPNEIGDNRASVVAGLRGAPVIGAYADKGAAMLNAALQPLTETGLSHAGTYAERLAENEPKIKQATDAYEKVHPIETTAGKFAVGAGTLAPLGATALGAKALGLTGDALLPMMARGAATGAVIGGTDAAARGEDIGKGAMFGAGGGAAGPAIGRAMGAGVEGIANRAAQTPEANAIAQAADRLGVDFPKVAASDSLITQRAGAALKELPVIGDPIVKASRNASEQMGSALKDVEQGYGSGSTLNAGDVAKTGLTDWITGKSKDISSRLYGAVDSQVNPAVTRDLSATRNMIGSIAAERQQAGLPGTSKAIDHVIDAVQRPGGLNYEGVKTLRTSVGEMLDNGVLPADIRRTELKRIYGALTNDLRDTVQQAGGQNSLTAFNKANNVHNMISQRREQLAKVVGSDASAAPERIIDRLIGFASGSSRADFQKLALARKSIGGGNWDEVASAAVSKIGRDADGNFSPDRFLTGYGKLSPLGKQTLFGSTGKTDLVQALEDIATLSRKAKELGGYGNPSGTGRVLGGLTTAGAVFSQPHIAIPGIVGARVASKILAQPIRPKPTTLQVAARNADVRELLQHVIGTAAAGATPSIGDRSTNQMQRSPPLQLQTQ
jgi:hypothetical protein